MKFKCAHQTTRVPQIFKYHADFEGQKTTPAALAERENRLIFPENKRNKAEKIFCLKNDGMEHARRKQASEELLRKGCLQFPRMGKH